MAPEVALRGWHYAAGAIGAPVIVKNCGFGAVKEMQLDLLAARALPDLSASTRRARRDESR
jgi:hypothetical protein